MLARLWRLRFIARARAPSRSGPRRSRRGASTRHLALAGALEQLPRRHPRRPRRDQHRDGLRVRSTTAGSTTRSTAGPVRYILLTQGHVDHVGGVDTFREPGTLLVAQANNPTCQADDERIHRFRVRRSQPYWATAIAAADAFIRSQPKDAAIPAQSQPDSRRAASTTATSSSSAARASSCISTPGGETIDSTVVWLPDAAHRVRRQRVQRAVRPLPEPRDAARRPAARSRCRFVDAVQTRASTSSPRSSAPATSTRSTGRDDDPRRAARACATRCSTCTTRPSRGMNEGKDVFTLMREIRLPDELAVGEGYGKVSWGVRVDLGGLRGLVPRPLDDRALPAPPDAGVARGRRAGRRPGRGGVGARGRARSTAGDAIGAIQLVRDGARGRAAATGARSRRSSPRTSCCSPSDGTENFWLVRLAPPPDRRASTRPLAETAP